MKLNSLAILLGMAVASCTSTEKPKDSAPVLDETTVDLQSENDTLMETVDDEIGDGGVTEEAHEESLEDAEVSNESQTKEDSVRQFMLNRMIEEKTLNQGLPTDTSKTQD